MSARRSPRARALALLVVAVLAVTACGGGDDTSAAPAEPGTVDALDNKFEPKTIQVAVGDTVRWQFKGAVKHNVSGPGFTSPTQKRGEFTHTFDEPGTFAYVCTLHTGMKGTVEVS